MAVIRLVIAFIIAIPTFITPYVQMVLHGGVDSYFEDWSAETEYKPEYAVELKKDPDKDFIVLNFSDIQLNPLESYGEYGEMAKETIKRCIEDVKPDLITLSGDNAWGGDLSYINVVKVIDSFGIPWAAVMGNHDGSNGDKLNEFWCSTLLAGAKNSLFKFGPKGMGYGNYVINITENGKVIHSIFMMDSHTTPATPKTARSTTARTPTAATASATTTSGRIRSNGMSGQSTASQGRQAALSKAPSSCTSRSTITERQPGSPAT